MENYDVTVLGSMNFDMIIGQERLPKIGETILVDNINMVAGGKGANQIVQCSKLGLKSCMLGIVGSDYFGDFLIDNLNKNNVETKYIERAKKTTGIGLVNSFPNGELLSTVFTGANYEVDIDYIERISPILKNSKIVLLQLEIPRKVVEEVIKTAFDFDCYIILNAAPGMYLSDDTLKKIDCFVVNEEEANFYSSEEVSSISKAMSVLDILYEKTEANIVITLGSSGSVLFDGENKIEIPPYPTEVIETTGAGDSFVGSIAYGILNDYDLEKAGKFASKASSMTIRNIGAQESMPTLSQIKSL